MPGKREAIGLGALLLTAFLAYWPCLRGAFLWDDDAYVTSFSLQSLDGLLRIWTVPGTTLQYYPMLYGAFWLEHRTWGDWVTGYHMMNVAQHVCGAYLLTRILRFLNIRGAWLAGFIFALHPVCTEGVAWIAEQKSTLSGAFYLGAALAYLHFDRSRKRSAWLIGLALFVLALLSKTVTATLPAALLLVLWWRRGELRWKQDVLPLIPWLLTGAAAGAGSAWMERTFVGATGSDFALTFSQRFVLAGRVIWFYAGKVVWPSNLTFFYPHWTIDSGVWWQWSFALGFLVLLGLLALLARHNRAPLTAALFFAGTLFPALGFLNVYPFRYSWVADHFQYLACLGIIVPAAWLLSGIDQRAVPAIAATLIAGFGALTWCQTHMYTDPITLYRTTLQRNPSCWMADNNLAIQLAKDPARRDEAVAHFRAAIRLKPNYHEAWNNLGSVTSAIPGRQPEAMDYFRKALSIKSDYAEAHFNLGNEYYKLRNQAAALAEYRSALRAKQDFAEAHTNLGAMLVKDPAHLQEGLDELRAAAKVAPRFIPGRMNLAAALADLPGHAMESQIEYAEIIAMAPRLASARIDLGYLLLKDSDGVPQAVAQFRAAVALAPQSPEARVALATSLFRVPGKSDEAVRQLETALKLKPDLAVARQMLNVANAGLRPNQPGH